MGNGQFSAPPYRTTLPSSLRTKRCISWYLLMKRARSIVGALECRHEGTEIRKHADSFGRDACQHAACGSGLECHAVPGVAGRPEVIDSRSEQPEDQTGLPLTNVRKNRCTTPWAI